jgi:D-alanine-D-alanine ligase
VGIVGNLRSPVARRLPEDEDAPRILKGLHFFPALEVNLAAYPPEEAGVYTSRIKVEMAHDLYHLCPAPLSTERLEELQWLAAAAFRVTGCLDVARVDFRLDSNDGDKPYILEVNALPGLNPGYSDLCVEAAADGWSYEKLINEIVILAAERYGLM